MVFSHHCVRSLCGLGNAHLDGGAVAVDLGGQRIRVDRLSCGGDGLVHTRCCIATSASAAWLAQHQYGVVLAMDRERTVSLFAEVAGV
jgi:hypothetical protein